MINNTLKLSAKFSPVSWLGVTGVTMINNTLKLSAKFSPVSWLGVTARGVTMINNTLKFRIFWPHKILDHGLIRFLQKDSEALTSTLLEVGM